MHTTRAFQEEFQAIIEDAYRISSDVGQDIEEILLMGIENPLNREEARLLLTRVITVLRQNASKRGDLDTVQNLGDIDTIVERIVQTRDKVISKMTDEQINAKKLTLVTRNGISPRPVHPSRFFHGREIPLNCGFVKTTDISLWENNERLEIHLAQFKEKHGYPPTSEELLQIMLTQMPLPGISESDEFKITALANSIAVNGVRVPPIVDTDGTLLDGNRRVAACYYILNSDEFRPEQKRRVEYLFVWQLTEHAMPDDKDAVIVSLNFEDDHKMKWPEYVKAWKVYNEWQTILAIEPRRPGPQRERQLKRELTEKFALGRDSSEVTRYIKMVEWANDFQDYFINTKGVDEYEVKHKASEKFQYFDELSKGPNPGGVAYTLNQDESFKHLVFDLLFQNKFKNWALIRSLRYVDQDVRDRLSNIRELTDIEEAQDIVEDALNDAKARRRESRIVGANERIKTFANWLEGLPIGAFTNPDEIHPESLQRLLNALEMVEKLARPALEKLASNNEMVNK